MHHIEPKPKSSDVTEKLLDQIQYYEDQISELNTTLEIHRKALECTHDDLDTITEEDYDGHRTDYTTYWYCIKCGWSQTGSWVEPESTTKAE
jgi:hypothetical protein